MSGYRVEIDRSLCSGMASCIKIAPESFDLDPEGIATLTGVTDEQAVEAAECCPLAPYGFLTRPAAA